MFLNTLSNKRVHSRSGVAVPSGFFSDFSVRPLLQVTVYAPTLVGQNLIRIRYHRRILAEILYSKSIFKNNTLS